MEVAIQIHDGQGGDLVLALFDGLMIVLGCNGQFFVVVFFALLIHKREVHGVGCLRTKIKHLITEERRTSVNDPCPLNVSVRHTCSSYLMAELLFFAVLHPGHHVFNGLNFLVLVKRYIFSSIATALIVALEFIVKFLKVLGVLEPNNMSSMTIIIKPAFIDNIVLFRMRAAFRLL